MKLHEIDFPEQYSNNISRQTMRSITWNRFQIVFKCDDWLNFVAFVEISYWNTDICKYGSPNVKKAERSRLMPRKFAAKPELLIVD